MSETTSQSEQVIRPPRGLALGLGELWAYRELAAALAIRNILARYKQTAVGVGWAVLRPVITMVVFTFVFHRLADLPADGGVPYALLALAGVLPWQLFSQSITGSVTSMVVSSAMIKKVYFPRLVVPLSACATALIDVLIGLVVLGVMMVCYQHPVTWRLAMLPVWLVLSLIAAMGPGLWLSALNVRFRDVGHIVPFLLSVGMFLSPVGYSASQVPDAWRWAYALNPMVGVIDGFRWSLLGVGELDPATLAISLGVAAVLLVTGVIFFQTSQRAFADVI